MPKHYLVQTRETQIKELVNIICDECKKRNPNWCNILSCI